MTPELGPPPKTDRPELTGDDTLLTGRRSLRTMTGMKSLESPSRLPDRVLMFRRSAEAKANRAALQAQDEADRAKKKEAKEAERVEKRAARHAAYKAHQAKKKEAEEAKAAARAEMLAGSVFASTPCYDSLWTYAVVFPDRVEERNKDDSIAKVRFLRDVTGVERTMLAGVKLTGAGWSETFTCKGQEKAKQMIAAITFLLSGSGSPVRDDD